LGLLILSGVAAIVSVSAALLAGLSLGRVFGIWVLSITLMVALLMLLTEGDDNLGD
jgi:hypothetical protein